MFFNFYIKTKSKQSRIVFLKFFFNFLVKKFHNKLYLSYSFNKSKKYLLSLLKSHFVYKSSQEHIGFLSFKSFFKLASLKPFFLSWILSKISSFLFQTNFIKQFININFNYIKNIFFKIFIVNNFLLLNNTTKSFLNSFELFGENFLNNSLRFKL